MEPIIIVGGGLGGLSSAIRLAHQGHSVTLLEKNSVLGGKLNLTVENGYYFETGPTLLTMPSVLFDLFTDTGREVHHYLSLKSVSPACRYFFSDKSQLDIFNDLPKTLNELEQFNSEEKIAFEKMIAHGRNVYDVAAKPFLFENKSRWDIPFFLKHWKSLLQVWRLDPFRTLNQLVEKTFKDPRLRQVFNRFATYNGSSPYKTPATFSIIPFIELGMGAWTVDGGIYQISMALERLAKELGVEIIKNEEVTEIVFKHNQVQGVRTKSGKKYKTSRLIVNEDVLSVYEDLINSKEIKSKLNQLTSQSDISSSGFMLQMGVKKKFPELAHHNIFFSEEYKQEFDEIFTQKIPPRQPTIYLSISSKSDPDLAPEGCSNLFILVNVPSLKDNTHWEENKQSYRDLILNRLADYGIERIDENSEVENIWTPLDFKQKYNAFRGSIYGLASNSPWAAFRRPSNICKEIKGLYFVGGSTHPGGGIPLVLLSGKMVADAVSLSSRT